MPSRTNSAPGPGWPGSRSAGGERRRRSTPRPTPEHPRGLGGEEPPKRSPLRRPARPEKGGAYPSEVRPRRSEANLGRPKPHSIHMSPKHHALAGCAWRPRNGSQREDRAPGPTTRSASVRCAPHPLHTKPLGRPSAPDLYQSLSRPRKRMISPHPRHASARRPDIPTLVMPM
jgi:hypothetical protein